MGNEMSNFHDGFAIVVESYKERYGSEQDYIYSLYILEQARESFWYPENVFYLATKEEIEELIKKEYLPKGIYNG